MHVAVFLQHYHTPDCPTAARPYTLVRRLAAEHDVTLVTTNAWKKRRLTHEFDWVPPGVRLHALRVPYENAMPARRRLRVFLKYAVGAVGRGLRMPRPDVIYGSSTPLTAAAAAALVAAGRRVPWVFEVRDLWPDFPIQMGAVPNLWARRALYGLERRLYRSAAHVVAHSPDIAAHVRRFRPGGVSSVEYGTDFDLLARAAPPAALPRTARPPFTVLYAGSFGRANDLPTLLAAARQLKDREDVRFVLTGSGHYEPAVRRAAAQQPNLCLLPPQPYRQALGLFRAADVSVVPFLGLPVLASNAPSKLFDSLAAGTPAVVTNPGWTKTLVEAHGCGWYVPAEQPAALAHQIAALAAGPAACAAAGRRGAALAQQRFDRTAHMEKLMTIVAQAAAHR